MEKILVLGIGNVLMGDEGVGVHAIKYLRKFEWPGHVVLEDGGTGGLTLLSLIADYKKVILIDAKLDRDLPGTITIIKPRYSSEFPATLGAHDIGFKDLVDAMQLTGQMPDISLIAVSVKTFNVMDMSLSPEVAGSLEHIVVKVKELL